ncbi:hypothetical protein Droror1_Dr00013974 [Drosera rotundifolia]
MRDFYCFEKLYGLRRNLGLLNHNLGSIKQAVLERCKQRSSHSPNFLESIFLQNWSGVEQGCSPSLRKNPILRKNLTPLPKSVYLYSFPFAIPQQKSDAS